MINVTRKGAALVATSILGLSLLSACGSDDAEVSKILSPVDKQTAQSESLAPDSEVSLKKTPTEFKVAPGNKEIDSKAKTTSSN